MIPSNIFMEKSLLIYFSIICSNYKKSSTILFLNINRLTVILTSNTDLIFFHMSLKTSELLIWILTQLLNLIILKMYFKVISQLLLILLYFQVDILRIHHLINIQLNFWLDIFLDLLNL